MFLDMHLSCFPFAPAAWLSLGERVRLENPGTEGTKEVTGRSRWQMKWHFAMSNRTCGHF